VAPRRETVAVAERSVSRVATRREPRDAWIVEYVERRKLALRHIYGQRWAEVYNAQTMLKDDDEGLPE
jgi:hypothetical protein